MSRTEAVAPRTLYLAEPPAQYLVRPALVLDCSVLSAVLFSEPSRDEALQRMAGHALNAPSLLDYEVASVAVKKLAQGWLLDSVGEAVQRYQQQCIALHATKLREQCALAQQYSLSAYDAAYLWLAVELRAPLATFDAKLAKAAQRHLSGLQ